MEYIDIAEAKKQIARISEGVTSPLLLVGGLAVNQYIVSRRSQDIDLICDHEIATTILNDLYPSNEWNIEDINDDEYRPSYVIKHKTNNKLPTIKFGPKITQRESYQFIDYDSLKTAGKSFSHGKKEYANIVVPCAEALCYMKIVSFLGRAESDVTKLCQDLQDMKDLSNLDDFRLGYFLNLINKNNVGMHIQKEFNNRLLLTNKVLDGSNFKTIIELFSSLAASRAPMTMKQHAGTTPRGLVAFDLDGTLIKGIRHSWTLIWNELGASNHAKRKTEFYNGNISYLQWTELDCKELKKLSLKKSHFKKIVSDGKCSLTKELIPAITKLREAGFVTAIISGGIDTLLYELLPDADSYFDDIFINRFIYADNGSLEYISATEYDWDDKKKGTVGKNRGLTRLCEKYGISVGNSVFVGDDLNDFAAMTSAGRKIFYCGDTREFKTEQLPLGITLVPDNNLLLVADKILTDSSEELDI